MLKLTKLFLVISLVLTIGACASKQEKNLEDEFATDSAATSDLTDSDAVGSTGSDASATDEFADFTDSSKPDAVADAGSSSAPVDEFAEFDNNSSSTGDSVDTAASDTQSNSTDEFAQFDQPAAEKTQEVAPHQDTVAHNDAPPAPEIVEPYALTQDANSNSNNQAFEPPAPQESSPEQPPAVVASNESSASKNSLSHIDSVKYQSNQAGGTVVISADQPLVYKTRQNSATQQLVVEIEDALLPSRLKRTLNTKDMASSIGSVDMYQKSNSKIARFVIQLRPNSPEPLVQQEGNSLLIIGAENPNFVKSKRSQPKADSYAENSTASPTKYSQDVNTDLSSDSVLSNFDAREFLANNSKFYGKRISIETKDLDIRDTLKFLSEEAGVNLIVDDNVSGKLSVKLKSVPWDQAFLLILKSKGLAYIRQGNVLRVVTAERAVSEQLAAINLKRQAQQNAPLVVKRFFVGYADVADLEKKIKNFLDAEAQATGEGKNQQAKSNDGRGSVIGDARTSSLIVTDTQENVDRVAKLIKALDSQPPQVLIEGKVVEAGEKFTRSLGVNWSGGGVASNIGTNSSGRPINITPTLSQNANLAGGVLNGSMTLGTLDLVGDLNANLSLNERLDKIRVLSSPRITVLTNVEANIDQTTQIMLPSSSTVNASGNPTQTYQPYSFGVSLKVKPQISNESTVALDMEIKRSLLGSTSYGGSPAIDERKAKTRVIVKNGQTAVIGGVFQTDTSNTRTGIPYLKDIPILGTLFRGEQTNKSKNELIIFITPRILQNLNAGNEVHSEDF